jgi:hypothetical protein
MYQIKESFILSGIDARKDFGIVPKELEEHYCNNDFCLKLMN